MRKLLACVLSLSFCTFAADALMNSLKSGVKKVGKKVGKVVKKSIQGNAEEEQKIANSAVKLYDELRPVQSAIKELAPSDILLITTKLEQIFQGTLASIDKTKVHKVVFDEGTYNSAEQQIEKTILKRLNKELGFSDSIKSCQATYSKEEYDQLTTKIEEAVGRLLTIPEDMSELTATHILYLHRIDVLINAIIKAIRNLKVIVTVEQAESQSTQGAVEVGQAESQSTQGAEADNSKNSSTERTIEIKAVEEAVITPLSDVLEKFERVSSVYFNKYINQLDLIIKQLGKSQNDTELKKILLECKDYLFILPLNLNTINTYKLDDQSSQNLAKLNQWIHPPSEQVGTAVNTVVRSSSNAANMMLSNTVNKGARSITDSLQTASQSIDGYSNSTNPNNKNSTEESSDSPSEDTGSASKNVNN